MGWLLLRQGSQEIIVITSKGQKMIGLKELFQAGVHFGHKTSRWSPKMSPFIWGSKNKIHLIDISKTAILLERASKYLKEAASTGKSIMWVGTKKSARPTIKKIGFTLKMPYVINRWIGGTLSNFSEIKKAITRLLHLRDVIKKSGSYYSKKELSALQKEIDRLEKTIGGITDLSYPPAAIVIVDAKKEHAAIKEALKLDIPVIAMTDTNTDPTGIHFVIPSNDDAPKAIECIMYSLSAAAEEGRKVFEEKHQKELEEKQKEASAKREALRKENERKAAENAKKAAEVAARKAVEEKARKEALAKIKVAPERVKVAVKPEPPKKIEPVAKVVEKKVVTPKIVVVKKKEETPIKKATATKSTAAKKPSSTKKATPTKKTTTTKKPAPTKKPVKKVAPKKTSATSKSKSKGTKKR